MSKPNPLISRSGERDATHAPERTHYSAWRDEALRAGNELLPLGSDYPVGINGTMRANVLDNPGKLVRPCLAAAAAECLGADPAATYPLGWAIQLLHCASLVLDDLPAMDNATTRRGKLALHVAKDEAYALVVALHMHNTAMFLIHSGAPNAQAGMDFYFYTFEALGGTGLLGGQHIDLQLQTKDTGGLSLHDAYRLKKGYRDLWTMCALFKTASLFRLSLLAGAVTAGLNADQRDVISQAGDLIGLIFQLADDIADMGEDPELPAGTKQLLTAEQAREEICQLRAEYRALLARNFGVRGEHLATVMDSVARGGGA